MELYRSPSSLPTSCLSTPVTWNVTAKHLSPWSMFASNFFQVIPQIDKFQENGYTKEEMKAAESVCMIVHVVASASCLKQEGLIQVTWELQKIFGLDDDVKVSCTAVRVPTLRAHSETIVVETEEPIKPDDVRKLLESSEGVKVVDDPESLKYPMPLSLCSFEVRLSISRN